tara:strand:- start:122 stop:508 length:387 start_codon:yes stop_codon:yes gene_type:complete
VTQKGKRQACLAWPLSNDFFGAFGLKMERTDHFHALSRGLNEIFTQQSAQQPPPLRRPAKLFFVFCFLFPTTKLWHTLTRPKKSLFFPFVLAPKTAAPKTTTTNLAHLLGLLGFLCSFSFTFVLASVC